ncbi:hypothetical protein L596_029360 [Steinernema carpocapsae]|uniref:Peptidase M16 N-terminal domain-containing protein n=1 Tax=Steinernema carpocapsae TaxID=34508 RepID=A0A4U5LUE8_STECR|nr:hypothetical protein L596_029360 [Steinernema carpocapsae]
MRHLVSDHKGKKSAPAMSLKVDSMMDPDHCQGLAHFCEHMVFTGVTKKYVIENDYLRFVKQSNGIRNASTHKDCTNYLDKMPQDKYVADLDSKRDYEKILELDDRKVAASSEERQKLVVRIRPNTKFQRDVEVLS